MENASLDDFLDDSEDADGSGTGGGESPSGTAPGPPVAGGGDASTGGPHDAAASTSGPPTSRWCPDGTTCAVCGETTVRLWHQAGRLVCVSCKDWE